METTSTPAASNGLKPRRERLPNPHAPGEPYGEAVNELYGLAAVTRLASDFGFNVPQDVAGLVMDHVARRLDAIAATLADQRLRYQPGSGRDDN